jgi:hypothetical protein
MAIGAPAEQAIEIFNELVRMVPAQTEAVSRIQWRLRALARSRPGDTVIGVARLLAELMLGNGVEAARHADHLWALRHVMGGDQLGTFLSELLHLGMFERAAQILGEIRESPVEAAVPNLLGSYLRVAWDSGSVEQLEAIVNSPIAAQLLSGWQTFFGRLKDAGLTQHLAGRQKIIWEETFRRQCFSELILTPVEETEEVELAHYVYVGGDYGERIALEEGIQSRLDDYFDKVRLGDSNHWSLITEILVPVTAGPSWHKDSMFRAVK